VTARLPERPRSCHWAEILVAGRVEEVEGEPAISRNLPTSEYEMIAKGADALPSRPRHRSLLRLQPICSKISYMVNSWAYPRVKALRLKSM
jgi:hypothetical protein